MINMLNVLFFHSRKRANKKGSAPIYCRITINKLYVEFSTGIVIPPNRWDGHKIRNDCATATVQNSYLDQLRARISALYIERSMKEQAVSPATLRKLIQGNASGVVFSTFMDDWFTQCLPKKTTRRGEIKKATFEKYQYMRKNITLFLREERLSLLLIEEFDVPMAERMRAWLYKKFQCSRSHCSRHLRMCRDILRYACKRGFIKANPLVEVEMQRDPDKPIVSLTIDEIRQINNYPFASETLLRAWHLFLFQCYTGLSYADLSRFEIRMSQERVPILFCTDGRAKNGEPYFVPLAGPNIPNVALQILRLYQGKLPVCTNQAYNRYLKEIAAITGIKKHLTTHVARKTFGNMRDKEGWSLSSIARMMGNTEEVLRTHYIEKTEDRILAEARRLRA